MKIVLTTEETHLLSNYIVALGNSKELSKKAAKAAEDLKTAEAKAGFSLIKLLNAGCNFAVETAENQKVAVGSQEHTRIMNEFFRVAEKSEEIRFANEEYQQSVREFVAKPTDGNAA